MIALVTTGVGSVSAIVPLAEPSLPQRTALSDLVLVGKVKSVEQDLVEASPLLRIPRVNKIHYQIAVVSVQTPILGIKTSSQIRVGYVVLPSAIKETEVK
jgi:hypothetical protein